MARTLKQAVKELSKNGHTTISQQILNDHYLGDIKVLMFDFQQHNIPVTVLRVGPDHCWSYALELNKS